MTGGYIFTLLLDRLDLGVLDDFFPFRHIAFQYITEYRWRPSDGLETFAGHAFFHLRRADGLIDLSIEPRDDIFWQVLGAPECVPQYRFITRHRLGDRRHIGQRSDALGRGNCDPPNLACFVLGHKRWNCA